MEMEQLWSYNGIKEIDNDTIIKQMHDYKAWP